MPSWFKKVFNSDAKPGTAAEDEVVTVRPAARTARPVNKPPSHESPPLGKPDTSAYEAPEKLRRIVNAPVLAAEDANGVAEGEQGIRIKARVERDGYTAVFFVDRPVLDGYSAWFPSGQWAEDLSPLAARLFQVDGVGSVLLHNQTVTITMAPGVARPWEDLAAEIGAEIRQHLSAGEAAMVEAFYNSMPSESEIRRRVQSCIDMEINPGIASHSGVVTLERIEGNTVFLTMGGGCQGCAASAITLRQGIHTAFRQAVPQIGAIYDETDHAAGTNPYFTELPAGMA